MASLVSEDFHDRKDENERSRSTKDGGKYENPIVGQETLSELKKMFGISDSSGPTRKSSAKILPCCSDKLVRGEFSVAKTSCTCYQGTFKQIYPSYELESYVCL